MIIDQILTFFTSGLLEAMSFCLIFSLIFRYLAYRHSRLDYLFFSTFSREAQKKIQRDKASEMIVTKVDDYVTELLRHVGGVLPKRKIRSAQRSSAKYQGKESVSLRDYVSGERSLITGIQDEMSSFESSHPPNFSELTARVMSRDHHWTTLFGFMPIDRFSRMLDILPGIFIVMGIFGTFVGISQALPEIAKINLDEIEKSGDVLSSFVLKVTYAMDTSILGIVSSLVLTLINALFPITETRRNIFKRVSNSLEQLWYFLQTSPKEQQQNVLPEILKAVQSIERTSSLRHNSSQEAS